MREIEKKLPTWARQFLKSVWLFPAIVGLCVIILSACRISGTSVGIYYQFFYGNSRHDPNLLYGTPEAVRSDEWLTNTQLTIAQSVSGYPHINHNIEQGRDMSLIVDVPYKEWSVLFKPQNLIFFILPLEYAFAFKWWLLLSLLLLSSYFFFLRIFPGKRLIASLLATALGFSPFVFWWYQTITIAPLFYGFFLLLLGTRIINNEPLKFLNRFRYGELITKGIYVLSLAYILTAFALVLYPPFQIPVAIVVALYLLGQLCNNWLSITDSPLKTLLPRLAVFACAILVCGFLVGAYILTRDNVVKAVNGTVYPGARIVASGDYAPFKLFSGFIQPQLQRSAKAANYYTNQSEASNFILLAPFLLLPGIVLSIIKWRETKTIDWSFMALHLCSLVFLADIFLPGPQLLFKLFFLHKVPHERLLIGFGFLNLIYVGLFIKELERLIAVKSPKSHRHPTPYLITSIIYSVACLLVLLRIGYGIHAHYPGFLHSWLVIAGAAGYIALIVFLILLRRLQFAVILLCVFSLLSVGRIHPLYRGLGPLAHNTLTSTISHTPDHGASWAAIDDVYLQNIALFSNRDSLSGMLFYPNVAFWQQVNGPGSDDVYNRYAHVFFSTDPTIAPIQLIAPDLFAVKFQCSDFIEQHVTYVVSEHPIQTDCIKPQQVIPYTARTFYIYKVIK